MSFTTTKKSAFKTPLGKTYEDQMKSNRKSASNLTGIHLGRVMEISDYAAKMGYMLVNIEGQSASDPNNRNNWIPVAWTSPFAGATNVNENIKDNISSQSTQTSYGMWMQPPDVGNMILVGFASGMAYCLGCVFHEYANHMIPGIAAGKVSYRDEPDKNIKDQFVPTTEYNKKDATSVNSMDFAENPFRDKNANIENTMTNEFAVAETKSMDNVDRAEHPFYERLLEQGLEKDTKRGLTDSTVRRESPSKVFGILTPGGHQFVMDDAGYQPKIRFRTAGGAQVLLDDANGIVYVNNKKGTAWVELGADGDVQVFGAKSISMRAEEDFNIRADRDVNIEAGRHVKIKTNSVTDITQPKTTQDVAALETTDVGYDPITDGNLHIETAGDVKIKAGSSINASAFQSTTIYSNLNNTFTAIGTNSFSSAFHLETAGQIHMNGPIATVALPVGGIEHPWTDEDISKYINVQQDRVAETPRNSSRKTTETKSIVTKYPTREPYPGH